MKFKLAVMLILLAVAGAAWIYTTRSSELGSIVIPAVRDSDRADQNTEGQAESGLDTTAAASIQSDLAGRQAQVYVRTEALASGELSLREGIDALKSLATTNPSIAYDLSVRIAGCASLSSGSESIETDLSAGMVHRADSALDGQDFCSGVTTEDLELALDLAERSAASGLVEAQVGYVDTVSSILSMEQFRFDVARINELKRKAVPFLHSAARQGSTDALYNLYKVYSDGTLVSSDPARAREALELYALRTGRSNDPRMRRLLESINGKTTGK